MDKVLDRLTQQPQWLYVSLVLSVVVIDGIVYWAGGTQSACPHLMYVPIAISAFRYGLVKSVFIALLAGFTLGPLMPLNVTDGTMQSTLTWILRFPFYMGISFIISFLSYRLRTAAERQKKKAYEDVLTGLPNETKFIHDIGEKIDTLSPANFFLVMFTYENFDFIRQYIGFEAAKRSLFKLADIAASIFGEHHIYALSENKIAVITSNTEDETKQNSCRLLSEFNKPVMIDADAIPVNINLKCGIVHYPSHGDSADDLRQNLGRALDQAEAQNRSLMIYNNAIARESIDLYATILTIHYAVEHDMFYMVYQPKLNIQSGEVSGAEALLRLDSVNINPAQIVKIAEDIGLIDRITKTVIKKSVDQLKIWQEQGIHTHIAVNISSKDLKDMSVIEYAKDYITQSGVDPECMEFEITERALIENFNTAKDCLRAIRAIGIKISLDDFGTGYNSLLNLMDLPLDCVKIDKYFVDHMHEPKGRVFIEDIIALLQNLGWEIIAEGVETKEQMDTLKAMGCDIIQGYYYSKPLPASKATAHLYSYVSSKKTQPLLDGSVQCGVR